MERLDADSKAVAEMQRLRQKYGPDPVLLNLAGRRFALLLDPADVHRVLDESPDPFTPASLEKRGALGHFQPEGVLVSDPKDRAQRRPFNEKVLKPGEQVHPQTGSHMAQIVSEEVDALLGHVDFEGMLDWPVYVRMWQRLVRRVVLGNSARDDEQVTDDLLTLRRWANFSYLSPRRPKLRARFLGRVQHYLDLAEPGSLAAIASQIPDAPDVVPQQQIPQWLFAFDAGSWASIRALALLTNNPEALSRANEDLRGSSQLQYLRATMLESLRLWPTTPLILRDTTRETRWRNGTLPAGASIVIFAPFFHRDDERLANAHSFDPEQWLRPRTNADWPLVPFSGGPAMCPGRDVVLQVSAMVLGRLVGALRFTPNRQIDHARVPGLLDPFALRFATGAH